MKEIKPIFILASPRSGTTILYNLFTRHKDTSFPEHFADKYYDSPWKFGLIPIMLKQQMLRFKIRPLPHEGKFLSRFFPFGTTLDENDVTPEIKSYFYKLIKFELKAFHAKKFVCKQVDFSMRIKFLKKLFPDAQYIIIWRNPRAVVGSLYTQMQGDWKQEPNKPSNERGWLQTTENFGKNETLLDSCINFYQNYVNSIQSNYFIIKDNSIEVNYEDFVKDPHEQLKRLYEFTGLNWNDELEKEIPQKLDTQTNNKWTLLSKEIKNKLQKTFPNY